jgi:arabinofuranosyltransferase
MERNYRPLLGVELVAFGVVAWLRRFVLDDAFISLRYAEHMVAGHGLVWNAGERVEGYTSFVWTLILSVPLYLGWDPIAFIEISGPFLLVGTLALTARLSRNLFADRSVALFVVLLLGSNATFLAYATSGLETQLLALSITALFATVTLPGPISSARALVISLLTAACLLARLDSALPASCAWLGLLGRLRSDEPRLAARDWLRVISLLCLPCLVIVGTWLAWKLSFYGDVLPNTFYAKVSGEAAWRNGAHFFATFASSYLLWPCLLLVVMGTPRMVRAYPGTLALLLALGASYLYIASVGGDFMEFRFVVPTLALLMCTITGAALALLTRELSRMLVAVLVVCGSGYHALSFEYDGGIEGIEPLAGHLLPSGDDWIGIGRRLHDSLPERSSVRIATTAAGAIPYYSKLAAVDMLGLTDSWIALNGEPAGLQIGHTRLAPISYLHARGVHLVFGHPMVQNAVAPAQTAFRFELITTFPYFIGVSRATVPEGASLLSIPLADGRVVLAVQLLPHPDVDQAVAHHGWRRFALMRE